MTPTIVVENNGGKPTVKMVAGASGGTKITTGTAQVLIGLEMLNLKQIAKNN